MAALNAGTRLRSAAADDRSVTLGMHSRVVLDRDMQRISVGSPRILDVQVINSRELLALGRSIGRTNLLVWYADGTTETDEKTHTEVDEVDTTST